MKALSQAKLPPQRFHDLRHAAASLLLAQGVNPRVAMEILGHSQISLTLNTYSHVMPELQHDLFARHEFHVRDEMTPQPRTRRVEVRAHDERKLRERAVFEVSVFGRNHVPPEVPAPT